MKILLIDSNSVSTPYPVYPLGLSMIAGALKNAGHEVMQCAFLQYDQSAGAIGNLISESHPDMVGVSIRNIDNVNLLHEQRYIDVIHTFVQTIRKRSAATIVLGGSGFSIMPEIILRTVGADYGIVGEGEALIVAFANNAAQGVYPETHCIYSSTPLPGTDIPSAYYDSSLMQYFLKESNIASVQTKRGCTRRCVYCTYPLLEGSWIRCRNPKAVVDDIQRLVETHGVQYIFFADSVFNDNEGAYITILQEMKKRDIYVPWTAFFKPDGLDDANIALMKETGLKNAEIGSDAATDTTLRHLGKSYLFKDIIACNDLFARYGITTAHYFMFGGPGESRQTVLEGIDNIRNLQKTVSFIFMGIRILPHTRLVDIAIKDGLITHDQELIDPVYYISSRIKKDWLEKVLTESFSGLRHCVFPPDALDSKLQFLHKLGYTDLLWDAKTRQ